jgi:hypothetical protein
MLHAALGTLGKLPLELGDALQKLLLRLQMLPLDLHNLLLSLGSEPFRLKNKAVCFLLLLKLASVLIPLFVALLSGLPRLFLLRRRLSVNQLFRLVSPLLSLPGLVTGRRVSPLSFSRLATGRQRSFLPVEVASLDKNGTKLVEGNGNLGSPKTVSL